MANEIDKVVKELMEEAGIEEFTCKPDPSTGELVCSLTNEQVEALESVGFEPKRVVYDIRSTAQKHAEAKKAS